MDCEDKCQELRLAIDSLSDEELDLIQSKDIEAIKGLRLFKLIEEMNEEDIDIIYEEFLAKIGKMDEEFNYNVDKAKMSSKEYLRAAVAMILIGNRVCYNFVKGCCELRAQLLERYEQFSHRLEAKLKTLTVGTLEYRQKEKLYKRLLDERNGFVTCEIVDIVKNIGIIEYGNSILQYEDRLIELYQTPINTILLHPEILRNGALKEYKLKSFCATIRYDRDEDSEKAQKRAHKVLRLEVPK